MVVFVAFLQSAKNRNRRKFVGFIDHHGLETAFQRLVFLEIFLVFVERRRADGTQFATRQRRFQDVGRVHRTLTAASPDERVDFVDEKDDFALGLRHFLHHAFESFLELALVLRTGQQRTHIERVKLLVFQVFRHVAAHDSLCQALDNGRFTRARLTDENRVVFRASRQDLQHTPNLVIAPDDGVEFAFSSIIDEVFRVFRECLEILVAAHRLHFLTLTQVADGLQQRFFGDSSIFQNAARRTVHAEQGQQHRLHRYEFVAHFPSLVHRPLQHLIRGVCKIRLAALHTRQMGDFALDKLLQLPHIHARLAEQIVRHVLRFLHNAVEQVDGFNRLLSSRLRTTGSRLHSLLRLDRKFV